MSPDTPTTHPLDPDSERGKQVAADLAAVFRDHDERLAREAERVRQPNARPA